MKRESGWYRVQIVSERFNHPDCIAYYVWPENEWEEYLWSTEVSDERFMEKEIIVLDDFEIYSQLEDFAKLKDLCGLLIKLREKANKTGTSLDWGTSFPHLVRKLKELLK